ncbi:30S ribosomal protein S20 [Desulfospira joergensenii]|uniref:30S ribosomal protein S20 n=1 Tax=Desulfospira joergensenii TaxID=53329 RepID=UPI0003B6D379|nr:30S ribosomal protein S20 [Desulfospira joergensenii]
MANHKSAKKRAKQSQVRRLRNKSAKTSLKTLEKKVRAAKEAGEDAKDELMRQTQSALHKAAKKGIIHKKTASRKISRLSKLVNA